MLGCGALAPASQPGRSLGLPGGNGAAPSHAVNGRPLWPPAPRQLARWEAIQQAQLQGLSMRATARLLGISRVTVSNYVGANGVTGGRTRAVSPLPERRGTDRMAALQQ